jgi:hypothetical protein
MIDLTSIKNTDSTKRKIAKARGKALLKKDDYNFDRYSAMFISKLITPAEILDVETYLANEVPHQQHAS